MYYLRLICIVLRPSDASAAAIEQRLLQQRLGGLEQVVAYSCNNPYG